MLPLAPQLQPTFAPTTSKVPHGHKTLRGRVSSRADERCEGCELYKNATQTVFGEGRRSAEIMLVGEMPGDQEDLQGRPFVGPAGRLLEGALEKAEVARGEVYVTNAVKHFRWEETGQTSPAQKARLARN
ncbi:MAG: uracil-DNA glycosylase family protein [Pirellulales bacterium]